jgi:hypothetical protein
MREMDTTWHDSERLNTAVRTFHDKYARQPPKLEQARQMHAQYIREIEDYFRSKDICLRIEYSGSSYEGTKVSKSPYDDDLEFDVMVVMVRYCVCWHSKEMQEIIFVWSSTYESIFWVKFHGFGRVTSRVLVQVIRWLKETLVAARVHVFWCWII